MSSMKSMVSNHAEVPLLKRLEGLRLDMARVDLKKVEELETDAREGFGRVLRRAVAISGWSEKEACAALGAVIDPEAPPIDKGQFSRWMSGKENPQMWRWMLVPRLRESLRHAEALDAGLMVEMVIRRPA